jgi:hypothetical protein
MRWLYAIPSSDTGVHSRATAYSRSLALMSARISPVATAASSSEPNRIDEIVPPGTDVGTLDQAYLPPALLNPGLRRRPAGERTAA